MKGHNARVLKSHRKEEPGCRDGQGDQERECNCRRGNTCPLGGKCLIKNIIYQATVSTDGDEDKDHYYTGQTTTTFKERLYNHTHSFKKASKRKSCALAQYIWDLKLAQKEYSISWKILKQSTTYKRESRKCGLCEDEKFLILESMRKYPDQTINLRTDLLKGCSHKQFELLSNVHHNPGNDEQQEFDPG